MADTPQAPSQPYGPFTDVLTGPLSGQRQQALQQPSGWGGPGAALANYANAFIKSAQVGQREKYERSEMEKAAHERNFDSVHSYIQNSPNISSEGKKAAEQAYLTGKFANVAGHSAENEKDHKDHPLSQLTRAITQGVLGPGDNKKHKDMGVDVNALLNIANDERYKIDPGAMRAGASSAISDTVRRAAEGAPATLGTQASALPATPRPIPVPAMGAAPAEPFSADNAVQYQPPTNVAATPPTPPAPATIQGFGMATPARAGTADTDAVPGHRMTQDEALRNPVIQAKLSELEKNNIDWRQDPYLSQLLGSLPKYSPPVPYGAPHQVNVGGVPMWEQEMRHSDGSVSYERNPTPAVPSAAGNRISQNQQHTTLSDAITWQSQNPGQYPFMGPPGPNGEAGKPLDLRALAQANPNTQLQQILTPRGSYYQPYSPVFHQVRVGNREYVVSAEQMAQLPQGAGTDLGQYNPGSTRMVPQTLTDANGNQMIVMVPSATSIAAPGIPGRPQGASPAAVPSPTQRPPTAPGAPVTPPLNNAVPRVNAAPGGVRQLPLNDGGQVFQPQQSAASPLKIIPLPALTASEMTKQRALLAPLQTASVQLFGDPNHPEFKGLASYADLADDPHAQASFQAAFRIAQNNITHSQGQGGSLLDWAKNKMGITQAIAQSQSEVMAGAVEGMTQREKEAFNATMAAYGTIVGLRSITKASNAASSVARIEQELPVIGINSKNSSDFYNQLSKPAEEIAAQAGKISEHAYQGGKAEKDRYVNQGANLQAMRDPVVILKVRKGNVTQEVKTTRSKEAGARQRLAAAGATIE